ncbi:MAG TPA: alpha/beta hydrolase, partial [Alphaproteobacteria bacterium]|nr:alpha/beta hydrolase [Alphaproteobacteria bacterium]
MFIQTITPKIGPKQQDIFRGGSGAHLVWLHGLSGVAIGEPLLTELEKDHTVIAPSMPGRKDLSELEDIRDIRELALYYDSLLDQLNVDHATLVGHSFGAMLASEMAALAPKRHKSLTLISPIGLWNDAAPVTDIFARPYAEVDRLLWKGATNPPPPKPANDESVDAMVEMINGLGSVAKFIWPLPDKGLRHRLYRLSMPTLIVFGASDAVVPASYADEFTKAIEGAKKLVLKGSHMVPFEQPGEIAAAI